MAKTLTLTEDEANSVLRYLAERPYKEVFEYINLFNMKFMQQNPTPEPHKKEIEPSS